MRNSEPDKQLAPIFYELQKTKPDWRAIAHQSMTYMGLVELPDLIKERQDWEAIAQVFINHLAECDAHYQRVELLLNALGSEPKDYEQLIHETGLDRATIRQSITALIEGGLEIEQGYEIAPVTNRRIRVFSI